MIKDQEWLNLAVKNAQRTVAEFIEKSCERNLSEHRAQFFQKIKHIDTYIDNYSRSLNRFQQMADSCEYYNIGMNPALIGKLGTLE